MCIRASELAQGLSPPCRLVTQTLASRWIGRQRCTSFAPFLFICDPNPGGKRQRIEFDSIRFDSIILLEKLSSLHSTQAFCLTGHLGRGLFVSFVELQFKLVVILHRPASWQLLYRAQKTSALNCALIKRRSSRTLASCRLEFEMKSSCESAHTGGALLLLLAELLERLAGSRQTFHAAS